MRRREFLAVQIAGGEMSYLHERICVLGLLCLMPSLGFAQAGQSAAPEDSPPSAGQQGQESSQPTPVPPANGEASSGGQTTQTPEPSGQLPAVQVVQSKPKPIKPVASKPKAVIRKPPTAPPPAPVAQVPAAPQAIDVESDGSVMSDTTGVPMSPVSGAEIPLNKVPGGVSVLNGSDFGRQNYITTPEDVLQQRVPGVVIDDVQGNQFQTNVQFRGFESSPVNGVPQGLAVYENGVRINESFGDVVNWDFLPSVAINNMAVVTNNPVYGLNALGGAIAIDMKNGFNYHGVEVTSAAGSFGRVQGSAQAGLQEGNWAIYFGGERIHDDGYRDFSEAEVRRMFADVGFKNSDVDFHFNVTGADNFVGVTAAAPVQLLGLNRALTFTSPQTTSNKMIMPAFNGTFKINDNLNVAGVA
jgi:iron complex outermembrane recepter protein